MKPNESSADNVPEAASPFPPAFGWEASTQEAPTQTMGAIGRGTAHGAPPSYQQGLDQDLFQPAGTDPSEPAGGPSDGSEPPWSDSDPPPLAEQQSAWLRQGPEVFPAPSPPARSKQIIGIAVLGAVVMGLVGATVAYLLTAGPGRAESPQIADPPPAAAPRELAPPPAPLPPPVDTAQSLIDPPGESRGGGGVLDLPRLAEATLLPRPVVSALQTGGMTDGVLKTTTTGGSTIAMFALTMPDQQAATTVAQAIASEQLAGGLKPDNTRSLQGMTVMGTAPGSGSTVFYRAVYVLYNRTIYTEVFGPNRDAVLATFDSLISQQVTHAPPTVRVTR